MNITHNGTNKTILLPHFLGLGSQRCASTWLYYALKNHPDIVLTYDKETHFLSHRISEKPLKYYSHFFFEDEKGNRRKIFSGQILGEIDPLYATMRASEIKTVKKLIPDLKLILIIRNPVDRIISSITRGWSYSYLKGEKEKNTNIFNLLRAVDSPTSHRFTDYDLIYKNWASVYGSENILLATYDQVREDPRQVVTQTLEFLGLSSNLEVIKEASKINKNTTKPGQKNHIPPMLYWYLSRKWLPKTIQCQNTLGIDLSSWIKSMQKQAKGGKFKFYFISVVHYIYYVLPYHFIYKIYKAIQVPIRRKKTERFIARQLLESYK